MLETMRKTNELNDINCLIIDDDKFSRTFIKSALYQIGLRNIKEADNTHEAMLNLKNNHTDIILLDQEMPDKKGLDFAKEILDSADDKLKKIPIIMVTSINTEKTVKDAKSVGIKDYLIKPISPLILKQRLLKVLNIKEGK
ncbi:MAG: response regulator [Alphaproteobacteria bacterium]|nr:response regulator [Alphaproteobacteria bacterium]